MTMPTSSWPACPAPFNMARHVLTAAAPDPDKTALCLLYPDRAERWSYAALTAAVRGTATGLLSAGLSPGDRVLLRLGNTVDFPLAYLGALAAGLVPVPTAAALTEAEVAKLLPGLNPALILQDPDVPCPADPRILPLEALRAFRALPPTDWHMGDPERLGYIVYTSGTSGTPSAVMHAHRAIWARGMMFDGWYGLRADDRVLHAGAFNWTYTLGTGLMDPWTCGATALIPAPGTAAQDLPALLKAHEATIFAAAPGVYRQMLKGRAQVDLPHLRHGLSAGEKLADPVRAGWRAATGTAIFEAYGMSECSTFISAAPDAPAQSGALGCIQPGRRVSLRTHGAQVPAGTPGTIAVHRSDPGLMLGYLGDPDQTAARFEGDWFLTGDIAVQDSDGQITYLGRNDDMMNAGGFRVSPLEVESALADFPGLTGIGAAEVEVKPGACVIAAFYTAAQPLDDAGLHRYAETKLARYKQPRLYVHLPALPTGANGKVQRRALAPLYKA
ncbi:class I adenylate-forming enzyme family protein [uncultured Sulfitobacter sp.]|uniref:class I adenylate-forming enzyme family protein n=1 Tax=uncultured Sulfitobacter sp. TaxID=191468 RepID=UPI00260FBE70|nr:class I adenylate-forming enzyme family protein [uncultured Sulfitobacter sp.]